LEKQDRYQQMLMAMINDQWSWIKDQRHARVIDHHNAIQSLRMAVGAKQIPQHTAS
jgi:hypothetical protein